MCALWACGGDTVNRAPAGSSTTVNTGGSPATTGPTTPVMPVPMNTTNGCGNGMVTSPEQCDDGNRADDDACRNNCTLNAVTGFGAVTSGRAHPDMSIATMEIPAPVMAAA